MIPKMFQRQNLNMEEKKELIVAFFQTIFLVIILLVIIAVLLLIITALCFVSLLSIRYKGIIDILFCFTGFIVIIGTVFGILYNIR